MQRTVLLLIILVTGCIHDLTNDSTFTVACLGDSNTIPWAPDPDGDAFIGDPDGDGDIVRWCEAVPYIAPSVLLVEADGSLSQQPTTVFNTGGLGNTACPGGNPPDGSAQLTIVLAHGADFKILAFGTNDIRNHLAVDQIVACYDALLQQGGAQTYVALTPPVFPPYTDTHPWASRDTANLNGRLLKRYGAARVVDFSTGFTLADFYTDGLHVNEDGQRKRAQRAADFIHALEGSP